MQPFALVKQLVIGNEINATDLEKLQKLDIPVQKTATGFRLSQHLELLNEKKIQRYLSTPPPFLDIHPILESSNGHLMDHGTNLPSGSVCLTELQTAGRGRRGRTWQAGFAQDLLLSIQWQFPKSAEFLSGFSLALGISIAHTLKTLNRGHISVKWPNDILLDNHKLGGILIELTGNLKNHCRAIIGLGLNINGDTRSIEQPWSAINPPDAEKISRNRLAAMMIDTLLTCCRRYQQHGFSDFQPRWNKVDAVLDQPVNLYLSGRLKPITGIARGVNHQGALLLQNAEGITHWNIGEISLRTKK